MTESEERQQQELKEVIEELEQYEGRGTQLVSIYVPPGKPISEVVAHVSNEYGEAQNIKRKSTRKNVQSALSSIKSRLKYYDEPPENGLAVFSGVVDEESNEQVTIVVDSVPIEIESYRYHCDSEFLTEPLRKSLKTGDVYALVVLDRREAQIGKLVGSTIVSIDSLESQVPGKHSAGGQSQKRFERIIIEKTENFYKKVASRLNAEFVESRHELKGVLVGGPSPTKEEFVEVGDIHHELEDNILDLFDVGDTTERGLYELVENAEDVIEESQIAEQRQLMAQFFEALKSDTGEATYGIQEVYNALQMGAVETAFISESLATHTVQLGNCKNGHWNIEFDENLDSCSECGERIEEPESQALSEAFEGIAQQRGSEIEYISEGFEKGQQLKNVFGGTGALLRFQPT